MKDRYYEEIDIARGLAIMGVVLIHTSSLYLSRFDNSNLKILNLTARYSVPLFILISGFLHHSFKKKDPLNTYYRFINKKFNRIILPYLSFSILYMCIRIILENAPYFNSFFKVKYNNIEAILRSIFLVQSSPAGQLYFLPLLFFTILTFVLLEFFIKKAAIMLPVCLVISLFAYLFWGDIYLSLNPLKGIGFYAFGHSLKNSSFNQKCNSLFLKLLFPCLGLLFLFGYNLNLSSLKIYFLYGLQLFGALSIYQLSQIIKSLRYAPLKLLLAKIGNYSYDIYLLHEPYILTVLFVILVKYDLRNVIFNQVLLFALGIVIPFVMSSYLLRKTRIYHRFFLGLS